MARPRKQISEEQVHRLAKILCTDEEIAAVLDCSSDTLTRRFAESLRKGREQGRRSLRRKQYEQAMKGNTVMLIWLGKQYLGQKDRHEHAGAGGGPLAIEVTYTNRRDYAGGNGFSAKGNGRITHAHDPN